jgi:polar amino acid transport system permease protein
MWAGYLTLILEGAWITVQLTIYGCILALGAAFVAGLSRISRYWYIRALATLYIEFFRGTSIFVQLFWAFFVLPLLGIPITPMQAGVLALAITSIPDHQVEACKAINLSRYQAMRHVVIPQAVVVMLPTFGNNAIELLKATALVSLISLTDMTFGAQIVRAQTGNSVIPFVSILGLYFILSLIIGSSIRWLERRMSAGLDVTKV